MHYEIWATLVGVLLTAMALTQSFIDRIPVSSAMVYLLVGLAVSPLWLGLAHFDAVSAATLLERGTEAVVLVSLSAEVSVHVPGTTLTFKDRRPRGPGMV